MPGTVVGTGNAEINEAHDSGQSCKLPVLLSWITKPMHIIAKMLMLSRILTFKKWRETW